MLGLSAGPGILSAYRKRNIQVAVKPQLFHLLLCSEVLRSCGERGEERRGGERGEEGRRERGEERRGGERGEEGRRERGEEGGRERGERREGALALYSIM